MEKLLKILNKKPELYEQTNSIWDDEYISKGMLEAHLNENLDLATRKFDFVEKSVDWICSILPPNKYQKLLDLGCGPGIYAELLYKRGYCVTGVDISKRSIDYASNSALNDNMQIEYVLGNYNEIDFDKNYDFVTLIYCDFGVLSTETRKKLLKKIFGILNKEGVLLFDVFTPLKYKGKEETKEFEINTNGFWHQNLCLSLNSFYRYDEDNTFLNQYTLVTQDGKIINYNVWEHTFIIEELKHDLQQAGFTNIKFYGDISGNKYNKFSQTICIIAKKE
ncbi:class I SAM-dependent methyltransferase [Thomasclavelia sp.]